MRPGLTSLLVVACLAFAPRARAASALAAIAPEIARGVGAPANSLVVASPLASDEPAPRGDELAVRLASLVAGQIGAGAHAHARAEPFSVARALASKGGALVYLQVEIAHGQLRATADLYAALSNGWDRARAPLPAPRAHAFGSASVDAEVRVFLSPVDLGHARVEKARHEYGDALSVSCGDVDGDGRNDIVLVTRALVAWGGVAGGRFVARHAAAWTTLAPRLPVPLRDPLATSAIVPRRDGTGGDLRVGTSERGGVSVSGDLRASGALVGLPVQSGDASACVRLDPSASAFDAGPFDCQAAARPVARAPTPRFDAWASAEVVGRDGSLHLVVAERDPSGTLRLQADARAESFGPVGAELAVGDLDQDGTPEVATTSDGGPEVITVASLRREGLVPRLRLPVPAPVRALAACPPDGAGPSALVALLPGEVWIVR